MKQTLFTFRVEKIHSGRCCNDCGLLINDDVVSLASIKVEPDYVEELFWKAPSGNENIRKSLLMNFGELPKNTTDVGVEQHARAYTL